MSSYAQRYVGELLEQAGRVLPIGDPRILGEIAPTQARQPHTALFLELAPRLRLATTAGLADRAPPVAAREGLSLFELCAITTFDDPQLLWLLSKVGSHLLDAASPMLPYEPIQLGGEDTRMLLVPRWTFVVPEGPRVDVVEPLPVTDAQWAELAPLARAGRAAWVARLGPRTVQAWTELFDRFSTEA